MVVGGTMGMTGAPMFVSHAAMRAGAGIVWCGMPGEAAAAAGSGTEVITVALPATPDGSLDPHAAGAVLRDLGRFGAVVIGPGLGGHEGAQTAVSQLVADAPVRDGAGRRRAQRAAWGPLTPAGPAHDVDDPDRAHSARRRVHAAGGRTARNRSDRLGPPVGHGRRRGGPAQGLGHRHRRAGSRGPGRGQHHRWALAGDGRHRRRAQRHRRARSWPGGWGRSRPRPPRPGSMAEPRTEPGILG